MEISVVYPIHPIISLLKAAFPPLSESPRYYSRFTSPAPFRQAFESAFFPKPQNSPSLPIDSHKPSSYLPPCFRGRFSVGFPLSFKTFVLSHCYSIKPEVEGRVPLVILPLRKSLNPISLLTVRQTFSLKGDLISRQKAS